MKFFSITSAIFGSLAMAFCVQFIYSMFDIAQQAALSGDDPYLIMPHDEPFAVLLIIGLGLIGFISGIIGFFIKHPHLKYAIAGIIFSLFAMILWYTHSLFIPGL